jgi:hypothetical protein
MDSPLVELIDEILMILSATPQDVVWSHYGDEEELVADLRDHADRLRQGDRSRLPDLRVLFLPTGALQEIAISSGWSDRYLSLASRFDRLSSG